MCLNPRYTLQLQQTAERHGTEDNNSYLEKAVKVTVQEGKPRSPPPHGTEVPLVTNMKQKHDTAGKLAAREAAAQGTAQAIGQQPLKACPATCKLLCSTLLCWI